MADRPCHLEETLNRLSDILLTNQESPNHGNQHREGHDRGQLVVFSKTTRLEFSRFLGDDPTKWFNRANKFLNFRILLKPRRSLWPPTIWNGRPTNGGSGFVG